MSCSNSNQKSTVETKAREFGAHVFEARKNCGMSQKELANAIGVDVNTIQRLEHGICKGYLNAFKAAQELNLSIDRFLFQNKPYARELLDAVITAVSEFKATIGMQNDAPN